jgi:hypothetical protein
MFTYWWVNGVAVRWSLRMVFGMVTGGIRGCLRAVRKSEMGRNSKITPTLPPLKIHTTQRDLDLEAECLGWLRIDPFGKVFQIHDDLTSANATRGGEYPTKEEN